MKIITNKAGRKLNTGYHGNEQIRLLHWFFIVLCSAMFIVFNLIIISLAKEKELFYLSFGSVRLNNYIINGIVAQGQVIAVVLITLNPIKSGKLLAVLLCTASCAAALFHVFIIGNLNALPGIIIPLTTIGICEIISSYAGSLNRQISRVLEYSRIVKKNDVMLHRLAYYDILTELPNRKMMIDQMNKLTRPELAEKHKFAFVYLDLDNFKKINDTAGHRVGDEILRQVAVRWKERCNRGDLLGRVGGDEFALLIRHKEEKAELMEYLNTFRSALEEAFIVDRKEFSLSVSFGITKYPEDGSNSDELFKHADIALYKAKSSGKNALRFFNSKMQEEILKRMQLENGILSAIRNKELFMVFQPQYRVSTNNLRGYEALLRWKHPELGLVKPSDFIPIAEETGLIIEIGKWIIETVLSKFSDFKAKYNISAVISINISVAQIIEPSFVAMLREILDKTGFDSNFLELEITESVFISYPEHVIEVIYQLKELGIRIALDDFGTGYASLNYLQMLPVHILKIDKTFIDKINKSDSLNYIVGAIISLSHQLGIEVVAEGVEEEEQLAYLAEHACDYIQGYLLSRPVEEDQIVKLGKTSMNNDNKSKLA